MFKTLFKTFGWKFMVLYICTMLLGATASVLMLYATIQWFGWHGPLIFITIMALVVTWLYYIMFQQLKKDEQ